MQTLPCPACCQSTPYESREKNFCLVEFATCLWFRLSCFDLSQMDSRSTRWKKSSDVYHFAPALLLGFLLPFIRMVRSSPFMFSWGFTVSRCCSCHPPADGRARQNNSGLLRESEIGHRGKTSVTAVLLWMNMEHDSLVWYSGRTLFEIGLY